MERKTLINVNKLSIQLGRKRVLSEVSFKMNKGECLAITGPTGSGKTILLKALATYYNHDKSIFIQKINELSPKVLLIAQQHYFKNLSHTSSFYYQQRFNSTDSEDALTIEDMLKEYSEAERNKAFEFFNIAHLRSTKLIQLSNGEHKRFQLASAILKGADYLLLDSPYTGLDVDARKNLNSIIDELILSGIHFIITGAVADMPDSLTHVVSLKTGEVEKFLSKPEYLQSPSANNDNQFAFAEKAKIAQMKPTYNHDDFMVAIKMVDTTVKYNNKKILDNISWKVNKGECWSVSGHNGSGKSTLLSLVNGDNPQAFANEIYLFDRRKGTGESIWDIKQKIGFVSPELHHYFDAGFNSFEIVASGLFDTIGLFKQINTDQKAIVNQWMDILNIGQFEKVLFTQLSNGEQRLVLLARALVKNPPLLILDEPCQGLDAESSKAFISLINTICTSMNKTMVYVTHYEAELPSCITHKLKLVNGKIAA